MSTIVTENEQLDVLFDASVTLNVLIVMPLEKLAPLAKPAVCVVVCPAQLSVPCGAVYVMVAAQMFASVFAVILFGQVICGA